MKKQILLVQSLLLLPLVSTSSLFSMDYNFSTSAATSTADLSGSALFDEDTSSSLVLSTASQLNEVIEETQRIEAEIAALEQDETQKERLKDIHTELLFNLIISDNVKAQKELAKVAHKEAFQQNVFPLLNNFIALNQVNLKQETTELDSTADINKTVVTPLEAWKTANVFPTQEQEKPHHQYQALLDAINDENKAPLKATPEVTKVATVKEREYWVENHKKFQGILNQLITTPVALKEPKMHPTHQQMLTTQSIMITQTPAQTGLDSLPYTIQAGYTLGTHKAHHIIEYLFTDRAKTEKKKYKFSVDGIDNLETAPNKTAEYLFDLTNKTHVQLLEETLNYYMDNNNTQALMTLIEKCQCTAGELQINPRVAGELDNYFDSILKDKETETQLLLKKQHDVFTQKTNALIIALQEEFAQRVEALDKAFDAHAEETNSTFIKNADQIRQFNEYALAAYALSPHYAFGKTKPQVYVTPEVSKTNPQAHLTRGKVHMTHQDVKNVYNNLILSEKIEMHKPMSSANNECFDLLEHLSAIKHATQGVKLLTNYSTTTK